SRRKTNRNPDDSHAFISSGLVQLTSLKFDNIDVRELEAACRREGRQEGEGSAQKTIPSVVSTPKCSTSYVLFFNTLEAFKAFQVVAFAVRENVQESYSIPLDPFSNLGRLLQTNEGASSSWGCLVVVISTFKIHICSQPSNLGAAPVLVQMT
ncbi:unnamed protein product, partial [Ectocarpus sp. 12 AP-2014]